MSDHELTDMLAGSSWALFTDPEPVPAGSPCEAQCFRYFVDVKNLGGDFQFLCLKWSVSDGEKTVPREARAFFTFGLGRTEVKKLAEKYDIPYVLVHDDRGLRQVCLQTFPDPEHDGEFICLPGDILRIMTRRHKDSFTEEDARGLLFGPSMEPVAESLRGGKTLQDPEAFFVEPPNPSYFEREYHIWRVL